MSATAEQSKQGGHSLAYLKDAHQHLYTMIRELSRKRFADITARRDLVIEEHERPDDFIYGSHLTVIQIAAKDLRITYKSHFNLTDVMALTQRKGAPERSHEQILKSSYDLFKEYNNLVAGGITQQLHSCGIVAGISLPIATSGFDELISSDEVRGSRLYDFWRVRGEGFHFTCSVYAEIFETELLDLFVYGEVAMDDDGGEIELL
ncbi:hypothetical protein [Oligoflexus tunisiensis]|uniref:hypothetical protein n=1 Tax=Oligoflexus tunisiensis TaxID=708132 RepID=UPI00114CE6EE|nr:hypothetical protein [Oligoflexus tunisiensis]